MVSIRQKLANRYVEIIESLFIENYLRGSLEVVFDDADVRAAAKSLGFVPFRNPRELVAEFSYGNSLPLAITRRAPVGKRWIVRPTGKGKYAFIARGNEPVIPNEWMVETKITDATPAIVDIYAMSDEQALLAKLRYNRLLDIFTGVTCYSLQSHFRTTMEGMGQVETDEVYVGLDRRGVHYVIPVQAKGGKDRLNVVQIEQDVAVCAEKFPNLVCKPVAAQFMGDDLIALFAFEEGDKGVGVCAEKHYRLVSPESVTVEDLKRYSKRSED